MAKTNYGADETAQPLSEVQAEEVPEAESGEGRGKRKRRGVRRWPWVLLLSLLIAVAAVAALFHWQKWWRFDDAADIQGAWKVTATGDTIVFDSRDLKLTTAVSYEYRLDTDEKAIAYTFGELQGGGHYYFSADRKTLVIIDGERRLDVWAELGFLPEELVEHDSATDDVTVLSKVSDDTTASPSGLGNGISSAPATRGEREFIADTEPSSSSSSGSGASKPSYRSPDDEGEGERRSAHSSSKSSSSTRYAPADEEADPDAGYDGELYEEEYGEYDEELDDQGLYGYDDSYEYYGGYEDDGYYDYGEDAYE